MQDILFSKVNARKAAGPDNIPRCVIRLCASELTNVTSDIFNLSLTMATVLVCFKSTIIIPVSKKSHSFKFKWLQTSVPHTGSHEVFWESHQETHSKHCTSHPGPITGLINQQRMQYLLPSFVTQYWASSPVDFCTFTAETSHTHNG